jgi:anti-anti-sigma factor
MPSSPPNGAGRISQIEVGVSNASGEMIVRVAGKGCIGQADALAAALLSLSARWPSLVTLDLSGLKCVSCLAMGVLVRFRRGVVRAGGRVFLAADLQPGVRDALDRAGLMSLFEAVSGTKPCDATGVIDGRESRRKADDAERSPALTWAQLVELEPQLQTLLWQAQRTGARCRTLTDVDRGFGPVRNELTALIGFSGRHHRHPVLGSTQAYQVAYSKLYDAMAGLLPGRVTGAA